MATDDAKDAPNEQTFSLFWGIYGQVAAVLGALSLLVFTSHFLDVGLKGVIKDAFDWWVLNVRPLVGYPIQWLVQQLPEAWQFELPDIVKDYFAVGLVSVMSALRANGRPEEGAFIILVTFSVLWPIGLLFPVFILLDSAVSRRSTVAGRAIFYWAPMIYLGLIFAANTWLL